MSETISTNFLKDKVVEEKRNKKFLVQYGCSICGAIFPSKEVCDEHINSCVENTFNARDPLQETRNNRAHKRKLNHSIDKIGPTSLLNNSMTGDISNDEHACKKLSESTDIDLKQEDYASLDNPVYEATSHMLSDNEMLITLPYDQINDSNEGPLEFSNEVAIGFEESTQEMNDFKQEYIPNTYNETEEDSTVIIENYETEDFSNVDRDSTVKILSVFTTKPSQEDYKLYSKDSRMCQKDTIDKENKVLTILNTVNVNKIGSSNEKEITVMDILGRTEGGQGEGSFDVDEEEKGSGGLRGVKNRKLVDDVTENSGFSPYSRKGSFDLQPNKNKRNNESTYKEPKNSEIPQNMKKELTNKFKHPKIIQENEKKKTTNKKSGKDDILNDFQYRKELLYSYKEIIVKSEEKDLEEMPSKFAVYEFYDEEEEKIKAKLQEELNKEKELKKKTCSYCNAVFNDPMDVLRHRRESHKFEKIFLSKQELEPYMNPENKTACPLCFKFLGPKGYNSVYVKHVMTHCDEYNFVCRVCHLQFRRKDHWYNHEIRHLNRPKIAKKN